MLEGFKTINLTIGLPYISVTSNGLAFNKTSIIKLGQPSHVRLMMNDVEKLLAVQTCDESDENATVFFKNKNKNLMSVRWNNKDLLNTLCQMMDWDLETNNYRIDGEYLSNENAMIFDLNKATVTEKQ